MIQNDTDLSRREQQCFELILLGKTTGQIADKLGVKESTVKTYFARIMAKKGVETRVEIVAQELQRTQQALQKAREENQALLRMIRNRHVP